MGRQDCDIVYFFRMECEEQSQRLQGLFKAYAGDSEIRAELRRAKDNLSLSKPLIWAGMGASFCSGLAGALEISRFGEISFAVEASEWLHFGPGSSNGVTPPILVTTSGESAEIVELCRLPRTRPRTLICNNPESSCWLAAEIRLPILAGTERANATKTYVNSTAVSTILASEFGGQTWQDDTQKVVAAFTESFEMMFQRRNDIEEFCRGASSIEIIGRGPSLAGAMMGALCIREMTTIRAVAHSGGGFRHGPLLDVSPTHVAIVLALGKTAHLGVRLAKDCVDRGGRVVLVQDGQMESTRQLLTLRQTPVPEQWESLTSVLVPQALTLAMIERDGSRYVRTQTSIE